MSQNENSQSAIAKISQMLGLHPIVGFGMFAIDSMLFVETVATAGIGWVVSIPVAIALTIPCVLIQKHTFGDDWGTAIGKGLMVGVLTAIPTPLPSVVTIGGGVLGTAKLLMSPSAPKQIEASSVEYEALPGEIDYEIIDQNESNSEGEYIGHT